MYHKYVHVVIVIVIVIFLGQLCPRGKGACSKLHVHVVDVIQSFFMCEAGCNCTCTVCDVGLD